MGPKWLLARVRHDIANEPPWRYPDLDWQFVIMMMLRPANRGPINALSAHAAVSVMRDVEPDDRVTIADALLLIDRAMILLAELNRCE